MIKMEYNIYCDESCHLEHDNQRYMVLGGIICKKNNRKFVKYDIISIKEKNNVKRNAEIKWNKVSSSKFKYYAFIHLTHKDEFHNSNDPNDRIPDPRRAERIGWHKPIIEHYDCNDTCKDCSKILYFEEYYKNNIRAFFIFKDVNFVVIIEKRKKYNLLITGYYIEYDNVLQKLIKKYERYKKQKTPLT